MQKPINLHIQESRQVILNTVNGTGLDLSTLSMIINEVKIAIDTKLEIQLQLEHKEYLEGLEKEEEEKKKKEIPSPEAVAEEIQKKKEKVTPEK